MEIKDSSTLDDEALQDEIRHIWGWIMMWWEEDPAMVLDMELYHEHLHLTWDVRQGKRSGEGL